MQMFYIQPSGNGCSFGLKTRIKNNQNNTTKNLKYENFHKTSTGKPKKL